VSFEPRKFDVKKGETAVGKVVLYIPDDPKLVGRRFQVMLRLHGDPSQGSLLSVGLKPRLLFSIWGKEEPSGEARVVDFPQKMAQVRPYELGSAQGQMVFDCGTLTARNHWEEEMTYEVVQDPEAIRRIDIRADGTPLPDPSWVMVHPQVLVLPRYAKAKFAVAVRLPIAPEHFGRTYVTALRMVARRKGARDVDVYNKVRVIVPPLPLSATVTGARSVK